MIRTISAVVVLCAAILWIPLGFQVALFCLAVIVVPYRLALFVPAVMADALYAPTGVWAVGHFKMTILVALLLVLQWFISTHTRIGYGRAS